MQSYTKAASTSTTPSRSGANSPTPGAVRRRHTHKPAKVDTDPVVAASSDLTRSLHRARTLVQDELARSMALHETLTDSTAQLRQLGGTYNRMEEMLASSRDLLGVLMKSTKSDTWYLETTFWLLVGTLGWLIFRRWLYGPLWWLVWLPLRIVFRTGSRAVGMVGGGGTGGARMEVVDGQGAKIQVEMGDGVVPTAKVAGSRERDEAAKGDPDSMVEKVGKIVEDVETIPAVEAEMVVPAHEDGENGQDPRVRDEL